MKDVLTQMESRADSHRGRSMFENAHLTQQQRQQNFARALGEGDDEGIDVKDEDEDPEVEEEQDGEDTTDQEESSTEEEQEQGGSGPRGMAFPQVNPEDAERQLATTVGKKAAKDIVDTIVRPMSQQLNGVAAQSAKDRVDRMVLKFVKMYPELKRQAALDAVVSSAIAGHKAGDSDEKSFQRGLTNIYGDRKREVREQIENQMSSPNGRTKDRTVKYTREQADMAALEHYRKTGDVAGARKLKDKLLRS